MRACSALDLLVVRVRPGLRAAENRMKKADAQFVKVEWQGLLERGFSALRC
jgi:hypothetical protein